MIYQISKKLSRFFSCSVSGIYLLIRTCVCLGAGFLAGYVCWLCIGEKIDLLSLFALAGWIGIGFGFFGGIFYLIRK